MNLKTKKIVLIKTLEITGVLLLSYIIFFPYLPTITYNLSKSNQNKNYTLEKVKQEVQKEFSTIQNHLPNSETINQNKIIIPKIKVNVPIIESENAEYGLSRGAWHIPYSSTPDKGGNTVITGHRFKYLPPSNLTFYLFHELNKDDIISIIWNKEIYYYKISETKIVPKTDLSIENQTEDTTLTLYTCHPIYSTKQRLVIIAKPVK